MIHYSSLRFVFTLSLALSTLLLGECPAIPNESRSQQIEVEELSAHVHYLAQPKLKGRKPLSRGSRRARAYIEKRFAACGLKPWGTAKSYAQRFSIGTNMIGIMPGSDPELTNEIIILSAHYDHMGKTKEGMCLGAADNAAGVAALLEIAEQFSLQNEAPKRTICFAAFDREESGMLGAFSFSVRPDFDASKIAGVVNIDLLGRDGFDLLENHLFISGTASYPTVFRQLEQTALDININLIPAGMDLLGARGDHLAFENLDVCTLFFSCGLYSDYHKPGDTIDKVDFEQVLKSSKVISDIVQHLANLPEAPQKSPGEPGLLKEVKALRMCLYRLISDSSPIEWTKEEKDSATALTEELNQLLADENCNSYTLHQLLLNHADVIIRIAYWPQPLYDPEDDKEEVIRKQISHRLNGLSALYFRPQIAEAGQQFAKYVDRSRLRLFLGVSDFKSTKTVLLEDYFNLHKVGEDDYILWICPVERSLHIKIPGLIKWPPRFKEEIETNHSTSPYYFQGSMDNVADYCMLFWGISPEKKYWNTTLNLLHKTSNEWNYDEWLSWHLKKRNQEDKDTWLEDCLMSTHPIIVECALRSMSQPIHPKFEKALLHIISSDNSFSRNKSRAVKQIHQESSKRAIQLLISVIDNDTVETKDTLVITMSEDLPYYNLHLYYETLNKLGAALDKLEKTTPQPKPNPKTIGEIAIKQLEQITGEKFGADKAAWETWFVQKEKQETDNP